MFDTVMQATSLCMIFVLGMILNFTVIIVYGSSKRLKASRNNICVMNLIVCDVIFLVFVMPVSIASLVCPEDVCASVIRTGFLCQMTGFLSLFQCILASFTLGFIAVDRYLIVVRRGKKSCIDSKMTSHVGLFVIWLWAASIAAVPLLFPNFSKFIYEAGTKHCSPSFKTDRWFFWISFGMVMTTLPTMIVCYVVIAREVRRQNRKLLAATNLTQSKSPEVKEVADNGGQIFVDNTIILKTAVQISMSPAEREVAKRGIIMVLAFFLCWLPYLIMHACSVCYVAPVGVEVTSMWLVFTLTIWNPIIYVFNNKLFMQELKRLTSRRNRVLTRRCVTL